MLRYIWEYVFFLAVGLVVCGMPTDNKRVKYFGMELNRTMSERLQTYIDSPLTLLDYDMSVQKDQYLWNLSYAPYKTPCPSFLLVRTANQVRSLYVLIEEAQY